MQGVISVLDALGRQAESAFGHPSVRFEPLGVRDRPFSTVVRLRVVAPDRDAFVAFVKIYKSRDCLPYETPRSTADIVREEFAATLRLHQALVGRVGLSSPRPLAALPEHGAIVTQELQGTPLSRLLRGPRHLGRRTMPRLEVVAMRIGTWLRAYQGLGTSEGKWSADESRRYLDDRLRYIAPRFLPSTMRDQALALFDAIAPLVTADEPLVPIHADLCPENILVEPNGDIAVIDFATSQAGTRYHDVAHLYLHLELTRQRGRRHRAALSPVQDALVAIFDRPGATAHPLFRLMLLQHVVCHVTQLVDSRTWGGLRLARQTLARWRWRACMTMPPLTLTDIGGARQAAEAPARPRILPVR